MTRIARILNWYSVCFSIASEPPKLAKQNAVTAKAIRHSSNREISLKNQWMSRLSASWVKMKIIIVEQAAKANWDLKNHDNAAKRLLVRASWVSEVGGKAL